MHLFVVLGLFWIQEDFANVVCYIDHCGYGRIIFYDNSLELTIELPTSQLEKEILESSWLDLQNIARYPHTYGSRANDQVHDYLEEIIQDMEYDNDGEKIMFELGRVLFRIMRAIIYWLGLMAVMAPFLRCFFLHITTRCHRVLG